MQTIEVTTDKRKFSPGFGKQIISGEIQTENQNDPATTGYLG